MENKLAEKTKEVLERLMLERGLKAADVAEGTGLSLQPIYAILKGRIRHPHVDTLQKIADFLGISISQLIGREPITSSRGIPVTPAETRLIQEFLQKAESDEGFIDEEVISALFLKSFIRVLRATSKASSSENRLYLKNKYAPRGVVAVALNDELDEDLQGLIYRFLWEFDYLLTEEKAKRENTVKPEETALEGEG